MTITTEEQYTKALDRLNIIFDAVPGDPDWDESVNLTEAITEYEDKHYKIEE
ncbi:MAG: hypothetical protein V4714_08170 [Bacteroidota bacterium]